MATRRAFLAGLAAASLPRPGWADAGAPRFLAAAKEGDEHLLHGLTDKGESLFRVPLPARGHAATAHPHRPEAVAFARRPGVFALVVDCVTGGVRHRLTPPAGRQFNGHGAFSADGALLYTSEVVAEGSEGRIGLWDASEYRRVGEWASGGIGPHDMKRLHDGRLVIANGGIATDPADRRPLNIDGMRPNLTLLSPAGEILDQAALPPDLHQNSIRHLALFGAGVAFAMQWEGDPAIPVPPVGTWVPGTAPVTGPADEAFVMKGYAGSIAATDALLAVTSPRGGAVMILDPALQVAAVHRRADLCGVAPALAGFIATDGAGAIWSCDADGLRPLARHAAAWDNHLIAL